MELILQEYNSYLNSTEGSYSRKSRFDDIDWNERLLFIKGARGVGKTTMILQYIKATYGNDPKALYVSMDSLSLSNSSIVEIAKYHYNHGGTHLFIDEIHKYPNWSAELKHIYDLYKKLKVVVSGSSILHLYKGNADLSRRAVSYTLHGLSFREFINFQAKTNLPVFTLADILKNHVTIASSINKQINTLQFFKDYLNYGYYPYYLQGTRSFHQKLNNTINQCIETDIPLLMDVQVNNITKIKKLLYHIAISVPFKPNSTKLAESIELNRQTLNTYLNYLHEANIIYLLWQSGKSYSLISKPEKIYLHNPNICHLVTQSKLNIGNLRETFFVNQVSASHSINSSLYGDFLVDNIYHFEIGGEGKGFKQIAKVPKSYVAIDEQMVGVGNKIPLWLFGFLY
jgi:predicted AAA+ superfamily ATPase